jgi:hypothetical protein
MVVLEKPPCIGLPLRYVDTEKDDDCFYGFLDFIYRVALHYAWHDKPRKLTAAIFKKGK